VVREHCGQAAVYPLKMLVGSLEKEITPSAPKRVLRHLPRLCREIEWRMSYALPWLGRHEAGRRSLRLRVIERRERLEKKVRRAFGSMEARQSIIDCMRGFDTVMIGTNILL